MNYIVHNQSFSELSSQSIYQILQARSSIFVVEQFCVYQDIDNKDYCCQHLMVYTDTDSHEMHQLIAYCRIIPPEHSHSAQPEIGRVLVLPDYRGQGLAKQLMLSAIDHCSQHFPHHPIKISAQTYLTSFYQSLGFDTTSSAYSEDGIEHIDMSRIVKV